VFERFTERARQVVVLAQEEATALKHNYIGTEHILLGLLREEEGLAARVLESLDITVEEVRAQVARIVGEGEEAGTGMVPFTPRAKKVLELALREALSLGHNYIGSEHILLGLVRENQGVAARILLDFDADAEKVRNEIIRKLGGPRAALDPGQRRALEQELARVRGQKEEALDAQDLERAANLRDFERKLEAKLGEHVTASVRPESPPPGWTGYRPSIQTSTFPIVVGWLLFGVALGIGIFLGWLIWGL
jgi:ATP-dependent Clp protease ATP-binding subunit ClpA